MKSVNIKLSLAENVKSFVNIVNRYPYDVDLRAGRHVVDAKSILGLFSLELAHPVTVEFHGSEEQFAAFAKEVQPFVTKA